MASRVINPKIESIQGVVGGNYSYLNAMYDLIRKNKINPKMNPMDITGKLEMQNNNNIINSKTQKDSDTNSVEYFELQYHGKLTMNDVESFQIPGKKDIQLYDEEEEKVLKNIDDVKSVIGDKSISSKEFSKFASKSKSYDGDLGDYGDGEYRNAYLDMAKHDASTLTEDEAKAMDEYTNDPTKINAALKNGEFDHDDKEKDLKLIDLFRLKKIEKELEEKKELNKNITNMHLAFMKHKLPKDFVSYRGVTDDMLIYLLGMRGFDKEQSESILNESGHINHDELYKRGKYKLLEGLEFEDKTFVSTSTNELFARRRSNEEVNRANAKALAAKRDAKSKKEAAQMVEETNVFKDVKGSHVMKIKIPKGTRAMFTDTMYKRGQDVHNQDELLLDAGYTYRVDKVKPMSVGRYCLEVSVIS